MKIRMAVWLLSLLLLTMPLTLWAASDVPAYAPSSALQAGCALDLVLALDGSGSIAPEDFVLMKQFVRQLAGSFVIGPDDVNVGIIQFANTAELYLPLSAQPNEVYLAIDNMTQFGDRTDIAGAIALAQAQFETRRSIPRVVIIITDGQHNMAGNPIAEGDRARIAGTVILGVAVGTFDLSELTAISGGATNVITAQNFGSLGLILDSLVGRACSATVATPIAIPATPIPLVVTATPAGGGQSPSPVVAVTGTPMPILAATGQTEILFASDRDGDFEIYAMDENGGNLRQLTFNAAVDDRPARSADGLRIAWQSDEDGGGNYDIWVMEADGSNPRAVTTSPADDTQPAWSPDGSQIAFISTRNGQSTALHVMSADGSNVRQVSSTVEEAVDGGPVWSPDGQKIAYFSDKSGGREVYLLDLNTDSEQRLTTNEVYDGEPDWDPNNRLVFASIRDPQGDEKSDIYLTEVALGNADRQNATQLSQDPSTDDDPSFSPDGRKVAFTSGRSGNPDIWVMSDSGGELRPLTNHPGIDQSPDWGWGATITASGDPSTTSSTFATPLPAPVNVASAGPGDTQIAFASDRDGDFEIFVMDGDGMNPRQLTFNTATDDMPAWSMDGRRLAWESDEAGTFDIYVMNADGSDPRRISDSNANDWGPAWSPDGSQIAFFSDRDGDMELWLMSAEGGVATQLTSNSEAVDRSPSWSPDGQQLLYYSDKTGGREIFLLDLATGSERQLTDNGVYDGQPDWSLTGTQIVFAATRSRAGNGEPEIYIALASAPDLNGDNATQLTDNPVLDDDPTFSPDGFQVAFESRRDGDSDIWIANIDGTGLLQLTNDPATDRAPDWIWKP